MSFHLSIVFVILRELAVVVHQAVGYHIELQLLVHGIGNAPVALLYHGSFGLVDETEHLCADLVSLVNGLHHLGGAARHG